PLLRPRGSRREPALPRRRPALRDLVRHLRPVPAGMRRAGLLLLLALVLPAAAGADPPQSGIVHAPRPPGASPAKWGAELYAGNCSSCHGSGGEGIADRGPTLKGAGALAADFYLTTGYMPLHSPHDQPHRGTQLLS